MSIASLRGMATSAPATPKAKAGKVIVDLGPSKEAAVNAWLNAKAKMVAAETEKKQAEAELVPVIKAERANALKTNGNYVSSVQVVAGGARPLQFVDPNKYSAVVTDKRDTLLNTFVPETAGKPEDERVNALGKFFKEEISIQVKDVSAFSALLEKITVAVGGAENFGKLFGIEFSYKPTEYLHQQRLMDPVVAAKVSCAVRADAMKDQNGYLQEAR